MFDPYHKWLGIPPKDQPPNHYRLLGIELFEADPDVIDAAANKQMAYVQGCATGPHIALSQKLLNEIAAARLCLLTPAKKADYDAKLKASLPKVSIPLAMPIAGTPSASSQGAITANAPAPASPKPLQEKSDSFDALESEPTALKRRKRPSRKWPVILGGAFLGVVGLVIVAVYSLGILNPSKTDKRQAELPVKKTPEQVKEKSQKQDGKNIGDKSDPVKKTQPAISEKELAKKLAGTKWVNSTGASYEWTPDGRFLHNGNERQWKIADKQKVQIFLRPGDASWDATLIFNESFTEFEQRFTGSQDSFRGKLEKRLTDKDIVGEWQHRAGVSFSTYTFHPNGKINNPDGQATWTLQGSTLILRWPSENAPGGAWVDRCKVSEDGKSYQGRNQDGVSIYGKKTSDSTSP